MAKIRIKSDSKHDPIKVNKTLKPVPREESNSEVERGEVVVTSGDVSGLPEVYTVSGKRHYQGGTPAELRDQWFVFSRDRSLRIKNEDILDEFGKKPKKVGYDPAEIAKQYDVNKYRKILADPNSDSMQRETAELMIQNLTKKLGKLALVQESQKGMPNGVPFVAIPYLESMSIDPTSLVTGTGSGEDVETDTMKTGGTYKVKVRKLATYQKGGPKAPEKEFAFNPEFLEAFAKKIGPGFEGALSPYMADSRGMIPDKQHAAGKAYGRKDWTSAEHFPDFRNRNEWYFKDHPEFDPRDQKQVKAFQQAYNAKATEKVGVPYFTDKPGSKYSVDGKFGEVTYSVPNLDFSAQSPATPPAAAQTSPEVPPQVQIGQPVPKTNGDNPFWTQDLMKYFGAQADYSRINKYLPWQAGYETRMPTPTFYDPTRELGANSEQSAIAEQALGAFAGPQELSSRMSDVQGKALANAANILGKYNNLNVGVANQFELAQTDILNKDSLNRANRTTDLYDKTVAANQNFDNAHAMARQNIRQAMIDGISNRGTTQALNAMNKQYRVNPTNGFVEFTGVPGRLKPQVQGKQLVDQFNELLANPVLQQHPEVAYKIALKSMGITPDDEIDSTYMRQYAERIPK
jgi:hypothetical protein